MKNQKFGDKVIGTHYIIDMFGCNRKQINSSSFLEKVFKESIVGTDIIMLEDSYFSFDPQGVTGFLLLSTSHISFHSWPEYEYLSVDVYTCSCDKMTRKVVDYITGKISHKKIIIKNIDRTYSLLSQNTNESVVLEMDIYKDGSKQNINVLKRVENVKSAFQQIEIVDTKKFGRCMLIDGIMQTSEKDHELYDQAILKGLSIEDKEIIILGGGDGYVAEMALKLNPNIKITIVDLDAEVVGIAKNYLNQKVFDHPNVRVYIGDALQYLKAVKGDSVDGIVSDLTDNPALEFDNTYEDDYTRFFEQLIPLVKKRLAVNGWFTIQGGASKVDKKHLDTAKIIEKIVKRNFNVVSRSEVLIPSFGEENCFILAKD